MKTNLNRRISFIFDLKFYLSVHISIGTSFPRRRVTGGCYLLRLDFTRVPWNLLRTSNVWNTWKFHVHKAKINSILDHVESRRQEESPSSQLLQFSVKEVKIWPCLSTSTYNTSTTYYTSWPAVRLKRVLWINLAIWKLTRQKNTSLKWS